MPMPGSDNQRNAQSRAPNVESSPEALAKGGGGATARPAADGVCVRELPSGARVVTANTGDHPLILELLVQSQQAALAEDFQSRLDEPNYRACDRLLVRRGNELLGHVHVKNHTAWFEGLRMPLVKLDNFAMLPEHRDAGYAEALLQSAESIAAGEGAVLGVVLAKRRELFVAQGWSPLRGQGHTRADARAVLAHLDAQEASRRRRRRPPIQVRTWRHFELDQVREIYDKAAAELWGPLVRSEACWQWVIGRKAQDQVLLAVQHAKGGAPSAEHEPKAAQRIVGYAVVSGSCIVEMMTLPDFPSARVQLMSRACRDAIDRDHHSISLYTPAADPLHELLVTAGGAWIGDNGGPHWLMKLLAPERWVERAYPLWRSRARSAGVPRPLEFGIAAGDERYAFTLTRRSSRLERTVELPHEYVECTRPLAECLLAGNLATQKALQQQRIAVSHAEMAPSLAALFPARLFWQSPLEQMQLGA